MTNRRNLGKMGESTLEHWCSQVGIISNKAFEDRKGWDYFLEFPTPDPNIEQSLDLRPPEISCFVQVKSMSSVRSRISIKLSNWEYLVKTQFPSFFLILQFSDNNQVKSAYLVHIGEEYIYKVLKRLRKIDQIEGKLLHKKTLDLSWSSDESINPLNGSGLEISIRKHIGTDLYRYIEKKLDLLQEVGDYIPGLIRLSKEYKTQEEFYEEWVDLAIGVRNCVKNVDLIREKDIRFGIPNTTIQSLDDTITISKRNKEGVDINLTFKNINIELHSILKAKLFTPFNFFPGDSLPQEYQKVRITFGIGEIVINQSTKEVVLNLDFQKAYDEKTIWEHVNIWRLVNILDNAKNYGCIIELKKDEFEPVIFNLGSNSIPVFDPELLKISRYVDNLYFLIKVFDLSRDDCMSLNEVIINSELLEETRILCDYKYHLEMFHITTEQLVDENTSNIVVPILRLVQIEKLCLMVQIVITGEIENSDIQNLKDRVYLRNPRRLRVTHRVFSEHQEIPMENIYAQIVKDLMVDGFTVIKLENYRNKIEFVSVRDKKVLSNQ